MLTGDMLVLVSLADAFNDAVLKLHVIYCYRQNDNYINPRLCRFTRRNSGDVAVLLPHNSPKIRQKA
jgi:hypothetical protein